jgi:hypothetical protein
MECELKQKALFIVQTWFRGMGAVYQCRKDIDGSFHQQQKVSGLQEAYTIKNGIAIEKSS